jgi:hypothetical protein
MELCRVRLFAGYGDGETPFRPSEVRNGNHDALPRHSLAVDPNNQAPKLPVLKHFSIPVTVRRRRNEDLERLPIEVGDIYSPTPEEPLLFKKEFRFLDLFLLHPPDGEGAEATRPLDVWPNFNCQFEMSVGDDVSSQPTVSPPRAGCKRGEDTEDEQKDDDVTNPEPRPLRLVPDGTVWGRALSPDLPSFAHPGVPRRVRRVLEPALGGI